MDDRISLSSRDPGSAITAAYQMGIGVVELMIAIALGIGLTVAAAALFASCRASYLLHDDSIRLQDNARFAIDVIGRAMARSSFADTAHSSGSSFDAIQGLDNRTLKSTSPAMQSPIANAINGSDVLAVHFVGSGDGPNGDGTVTNCAGFGVGAGTQNDAASDAGWSIFYVAADQTGEPELYCKYRGKNAWATAAIARGVESFHVLYGLGEGGNTAPTQFLSASQIDRLDGAAIASGGMSEARAAEQHRQSLWKKVTQIKVALLLRGAAPLRADSAAQSYLMFGDGYESSDSDPGVRFDESTAPPAARNRLRKLFRASFRFHQAAPEPAS